MNQHREVDERKMKRQEKRRKLRETDERKIREMDEPKTREIDASNMDKEQLLGTIRDAIELNMQLGITKIDVSYGKDGNITVQPKREQEQEREEK